MTATDYPDDPKIREGIVAGLTAALGPYMTLTAGEPEDPPRYRALLPVTIEAHPANSSGEAIDYRARDSDGQIVGVYSAESLRIETLWGTELLSDYLGAHGV